MPDHLPPVADLRRAARALWPERRLHGFRVREDGWANLILEAEPDLIFRFPRSRAVAEGVGYEVRLLETLSPRLSVAIPDPVRVGVLARPNGWPFFSYARIPGIPLSEKPTLNAGDRAKLSRFLATLLVDLSRLPTPILRRIGCPPGDPPHWAARYRRLLDRYDRVGAGRVSPMTDRRIRQDFDQFLTGLASVRYRPVVSHRDLGPYNIVWNPRTRSPTGVLDWEDTRFGDPAFDLTGLTFVGPRRLHELESLRSRTTDTTYHDRLAFYRRVVPLQEMLFAIESGRRELFRRTRGGLERVHRRSWSVPSPHRPFSQFQELETTRSRLRPYALNGSRQ